MKVEKGQQHHHHESDHVRISYIESIQTVDSGYCFFMFIQSYSMYMGSLSLSLSPYARLFGVQTISTIEYVGRVGYLRQ